MARPQIADPTRSLAPYYEHPTSRIRKPAAHLEYVTDTAGPIPVQRANSNVQMTPIVQPVAFVPYSTQKQPIMTTYDDVEEMDEIEEEYEVAEEQKAEEYAYGHQEEKPEAKATKPAPKAKKKASGASIALIIFSLLSVFVLIAGKFLAGVTAIADYLQYIDFTKDATAYELVEAFVKNVLASADIKAAILTLDAIVPGAIAISAIFLLVTFIGSLAGVCKKGATVAAKVGTCFTLIFSVATLVYALVMNVTPAIGMYVFIGLSLVMMLIALISKGKKAPYKK